MTNNLSAELAPTTSGVQAVIDTARTAAEPHVLGEGLVHAFHLGDRIEVVDLTGDEHLELPKRKRGTVRVEDLESFLAYWRKHADPYSELYVDIRRHQITGVLDAHTDDDWEDGARWGQHRAVLTMPLSQKWVDWMSLDRKPQRQLDWAEFIEDHLDDIREPSAATMLEIAQTFQASTKVKFSSSQILSNGDRRLEWEETTGATAGQGGKLQVPAMFSIGLAPFDFSDAFEINARFRYRVTSGELTVQYLLDDPAAVLRDAVLDVVTQLETRLNEGRPEGDPRITVMRGTPIGAITA